MGIDKMNKDAAYDSLIDASKLYKKKVEILKVQLNQVLYKIDNKCYI